MTVIPIVRYPGPRPASSPRQLEVAVEAIGAEAVTEELEDEEVTEVDAEVAVSTAPAADPVTGLALLRAVLPTTSAETLRASDARLLTPTPLPRRKLALVTGLAQFPPVPPTTSPEMLSASDVGLLTPTLLLPRDDPETGSVRLGAATRGLTSPPRMLASCAPPRGPVRRR